MAQGQVSRHAAEAKGRIEVVKTCHEINVDILSTFSPNDKIVRK